MTQSAVLFISKIFSISILVLFTLATALAVTAQESTPSTTTKREAVKQRVETKKEIAQVRAENIREKIASREAALKARLNNFKDKRKATIAERVNSNLNKINQNQTAQMLRHLNKMSSLLDKLEARVNSAKPDIKDPAAARAAIATARTNIATTSAAVTAQSEKDYTITVTSESRVKTDAQTQREQLHNDLQALRKQVIDAKQSVANAIRVAKSGKVEIPKKEGTPSGTQ